MQNLVEKLQNSAKALREAANIIESQIPHKNSIWMKSITGLGIDKKAKALVDDVQYLEITGRARGTTWPRNTREAQKSKHLMGYQMRNPLDDGEIVLLYISTYILIIITEEVPLLIEEPAHYDSDLDYADIE